MRRPRPAAAQPPAELPSPPRAARLLTQDARTYFATPASSGWLAHSEKVRGTIEQLPEPINIPYEFVRECTNLNELPRAVPSSLPPSTTTSHTTPVPAAAAEPTPPAMPTPPAPLGNHQRHPRIPQPPQRRRAQTNDDSGDDDDSLLGTDPASLDLLVDELNVSSLTDDTITANLFRIGGGSALPNPYAGTITGKHIRQACLQRARDPSTIPDLIRRALVESTRQEHRRMIRTLGAMPAQYLPMPAPEAIISYLSDLYVARQWKPSTMLKYMATAQAACRLLPLYVEAPRYLLTLSDSWKSAMRTVAQDAIEYMPKQDKPATSADIDLIRATPTNAKFAPQLFLVLMLMWATAARPGCVLKLRVSDLHLQGTKLLARFVRGKGARARRSPYTVPTTLPPEWARILREHMQHRRDWLFPREIKIENFRPLLKPHGLTLRSLRRGSLQQMAANGVSIQDLMVFSGHTQEKTLMRYLNFGAKYTSMINQAQEHSAFLWGPPPPASYGF